MIPSPLSIWPADRAKLAAVEWAHTVNALCPSCRGPMLAGWLDRELVGLVCHRCGVSGEEIRGAGLGAPREIKRKTS
jgi:hypothetical protein